MSMLSRPLQPPGAAADETVEVVPVGAALGAELRGIDLSRPVDDRTFAVIHDALMRYQVIFFRDQALSVDAHLDLARRFGEPAYSKKLPMYDGHETVSLLENDGSKVAVGGLWHTDNTDFANPPMGSLLYAEVVPPIGGDTLFASMTTAFEALSPGLQAYLRTLTALHDNANVKRIYAAEGSLRPEGMEVGEAVRHPLVRRHPVTGQASLFVNAGYTNRIVGVSDVESRHLLAMLFEHVMQPEFQVRFRWTAGALAIWDNRVTQHYAMDDYTQLRRMRRIQIVGDIPQAAG